MILRSEKEVFFDFEFNRTKRKFVNPVSASYSLYNNQELVTRDRVWLHHDLGKAGEFFRILETLASNGYVFYCFQAEAEARATLSLIRDDSYRLWEWKWIDLWCEYRHLLNHNHDLKYGEQLVGGKPRKTRPPKPKWERKEGEAGSPDPDESMAGACYKLLEVTVDTDHKTKIRDLIISAPDSFTEEEEKAILEYNDSDIDYLPLLADAMGAEYENLLKSKELATVKEEAHFRAEYNVRTAYMVTEGYPYCHTSTQAFSDNVRSIYNELHRDINSQFDFKPFRWDKKTFSYIWRQKATKEYLRSEYPELMDRWMRTDGGDISLKLDAFTDFFNFVHHYPRGNFGAQIVRFLKIKQSLNGFSVTSKAKTFWDYACPEDQRVRPYFNIYRSQSARSQPSATGYLFLKAAWMRALCVPPEGMAVGTLDWGSQEFFIGALLSNDKNMIKAYLSGDPYLWFAKAAKAVPKNGERKDHEEIRDAFKSTTLAKMFLMGTEAMARKISNDTGKEYTLEDAEELSDMFDDVFSVFCDWRGEQIHKYRDKGSMKLPDGYYMWGDNQNFRSIANCPIQGFGSCIMRKAVQLAQNKGVKVILTLHDSLYNLMKIEDIYEHMEILAECMDQAFRFYFPDKIKEIANCRLDGKVWSPELEPDNTISVRNGEVPIVVQDIYIDKRAKADYEKFSKYFNNEELELL